MLPLHFENRSRRGVAQPGLEYSSGGRVVASSNLVIPTAENERLTLNGVGLFFVGSTFFLPFQGVENAK